MPLILHPWQRERFCLQIVAPNHRQIAEPVMEAVGSDLHARAAK